MTMSRPSTRILTSPRTSLKTPSSNDRNGEPVNQRAGETSKACKSPILRFSDSPVRQVVLGIDPGLATTGWGVVEKSDSLLTLHSFGAILTPARRDLPQRLL